MTGRDGCWNMVDTQQGPCNYQLSRYHHADHNKTRWLPSQQLIQSSDASLSPVNAHSNNYTPSTHHYHLPTTPPPIPLKKVAFVIAAA